jgi:hypothetical protein
MPTTLLSIISDQAGPNLLFIKQFAQPDSSFLFISTVEMEGKNATSNLINSLKLLTERCKTILIDANDAEKILKSLKHANLPSSHKYLVNLTGGNKLMSQMVFQHLQTFNAEMYYAPIASTSYQLLHPDVKQIPKNPAVIISLKEYLEAYGFEVQLNQSPIWERPSPKTLYKKVLKSGHPGRVAEIAKATDQEYKEGDKGYLMGTWFEKYLHDHFKETLGLAASQIAYNVGIKRKDSATNFDKDNEFDVMFIYRNDLYVFECKVYPTVKLKTNRISDPLFKLASLTQNFGLNCKKYFAYLGEFTADQQAITQLENIRNNLGIERIIDIQVFRENSGKDLIQVNMEDKLELLRQKFNSL